MVLVFLILRQNRLQIGEKQGKRKVRDCGEGTYFLEIGNQGGVAKG